MFLLLKFAKLGQSSYVRRDGKPDRIGKFGDEYKHSALIDRLGQDMDDLSSRGGCGDTGDAPGPTFDLHN